MNLLLTEPYKYTDRQIEEIQSLGYNVTFIQDERVPLKEQSLNIDVADIDAIVCNTLFLYNDITEFKSLKFIQLTSAGVDRVPIDYIKKNSIKLFNAKDVYSAPMAEWVVLKILEIYKKSRQFYYFQSEHKWEKQRDLMELTDKTAAIIGFGSVGYEIAKRLNAFTVNVIGVGRRDIKSHLLDEYYTIDEIDRVLEISDIVILTIPLTEETLNFFNASRIAKMKDNCVLVNVSRGKVINKLDLIEAVKSGKFYGVALDVFDEEPLLEGDPLWDLKEVIITPHNSFVSDKVNKRLFELLMINLTNHSMEERS